MFYTNCLENIDRDDYQCLEDEEAKAVKKLHFLGKSTLCIPFPTVRVSGPLRPHNILDHNSSL